VEAGSYKPLCRVLAVFLCLLWAMPLRSQENPASLEVPDKFTLDQQTAARLRPQLISQSTAAYGPYETGRLVFERLLTQVRPPKNVNLAWELRILDDDLLNAFASPDGAIYVDRGLAHSPARARAYGLPFCPMRSRLWFGAIGPVAISTKARCKTALRWSWAIPGSPRPPGRIRDPPRRLWLAFAAKWNSIPTSTA
jgi:hypothetical protein